MQTVMYIGDRSAVAGYSDAVERGFDNARGGYGCPSQSSSTKHANLILLTILTASCRVARSQMVRKDAWPVILDECIVAGE